LSITLLNLNPKLMEPLTRDPYLWQKAKARAKFQSHLVVYVVVNAGLWAAWALTSHSHEYFPWPIWASLFWGLGLTMRGLAAYGGFGCEQRTQREYERLVREQEGRVPGRLA
jgi:hypothetical protein